MRLHYPQQRRLADAGQIPFLIFPRRARRVATRSQENIKRGYLLTTLISFDIDGTLEVGDPPGCITLDMVRAAKASGCIIGSCSDRTVSNQQRIWETAGIEMEFTVLKHQLDAVKEQFPAEDYYHIGDTDLDRQYAERNGFHFLLPDVDVVQLWENGN